MKDPAMLLYTADFLTGVQLMDMKERGQYITLICLQQQRGHMTEKEMVKAVGKLSPEVRSKFVEDGEGRLYNERAEYEIKRREAHRRKQSENISRRWNIPNEQFGIYGGNTNGDTVVLPLETETEIYTERSSVEVEGNDSAEGGSGGRNGPDPAPEVFIGLILNDGTEYPVTVEQCREFQKLYPAVDVEQQLRNMRGWLLANPAKRKTRRGILRFITTWLSKEQDRGGRGPAPPGRQNDRMGFLAESIRRDLANDRAGRQGSDFPAGDAVGQLQGPNDGR